MTTVELSPSTGARVIPGQGVQRVVRLSPERDDLRIAALTALAVTVHIIESAVPMPLPGVKPGLANVITLVALVCFGWRVAAWIGLLRVFAGSLLIGTFLTPTFCLSLSGAVAVVLVLGLAQWLGGRRLSTVGFGVLSAMGHMGAQVLVARLLFIPHDALWRLLPFLMTVALGFGLISGFLAQTLAIQVKDHWHL